jgi:two-component system NarL family response regulator
MSTSNLVIDSTTVAAVLVKDAIIRAGVCAMLRAPGNHAVHIVDVVEPADGPSHLAHALLGIDVVIADYDNGIGIAKLLGRGPTVPNQPPARILVVTTREGEADIRRALEAGVRGYLSLGSAPDELTEAVTSLHRGMRWLDRVAAQKLAAGYGQEPLTERETDVLRCLVTGAANKTVAKKLNIALGTVKVHVRSIMGKLDARTRTEAATVAIKRGLLCDACDTPAGPPIVSPISPVSGSSPMETIRAVMTMS